MQSRRYINIVYSQLEAKYHLGGSEIETLRTIFSHLHILQIAQGVYLICQIYRLERKGTRESGWY
jgi:hypothetical protein